VNVEKRIGERSWWNAGGDRLWQTTNMRHWQLQGNPGVVVTVKESAGGSTHGFFVDEREQESGHKCEYSVHSIHSGVFWCLSTCTVTVNTGLLYWCRCEGLPPLSTQGICVGSCGLQALGC
jgi:hypothetical protein